VLKAARNAKEREPKRVRVKPMTARQRHTSLPSSNWRIAAASTIGRRLRSSNTLKLSWRKLGKIETHSCRNIDRKHHVVCATIQEDRECMLALRTGDRERQDRLKASDSPAERWYRVRERKLGMGKITISRRFPEMSPRHAGCSSEQIQ
jgi:hypothetical protein